MSELEITRSKDSEVKVLSLKGQLDAHTFSSLQKELESAGNEAQPRVVLDCGALEYISSAGLGVLKKMSREFRDRQGDIRLAALPPKIDNVVQLLGFDKILRVFGGLDEAVRSFEQDRDAEQP
ncbi:MAG: anti-sigma factor antagonist [Planctomycetota bacterium]|nr:MAG: anti-sigma factor antagonist [Planctomycetota bacterium]